MGKTEEGTNLHECSILISLGPFSFLRVRGQITKGEPVHLQNQGRPPDDLPLIELDKHFAGENPVNTQQI